MTNKNALLLSPAFNYAIVQLPERKFPGVVFQGDSLHSLLVKAKCIEAQTVKYNNEDLSIDVQEVVELLQEALNYYEQVCNEKGISLPYVKTHK